MTDPVTIKKIAAANADKPEGVLVIGSPMYGSTPSPEEICANFPSDERCKNIDQYKGETVMIGYDYWAGDTMLVQALIPKDVTYQPTLLRSTTALLKLRIKGDAPAYFEGILPDGGKADGKCEFVGFYNTGYVCPGLNYDYRDVKGTGLKDTR